MAGFIETTSRSSKNRSYKETLASDLNTAARHLFYEACKIAHGWGVRSFSCAWGAVSHHRLEARHRISNAVLNSNDGPIETFHIFFS